MNIFESTLHYEKWMSTHINIVKFDLVYKHEQMAKSPFLFMRATFYRWLQLWKELGSTEATAPRLLQIRTIQVPLIMRRR